MSLDNILRDRRMDKKVLLYWFCFQFPGLTIDDSDFVFDKHKHPIIDAGLQIIPSFFSPFLSNNNVTDQTYFKLLSVSSLDEKSTVNLRSLTNPTYFPLVKYLTPLNIAIVNSSIWLIFCFEYSLHAKQKITVDKLVNKQIIVV